MDESVPRRWSSRKLWVASLIFLVIIVLLVTTYISEQTFQWLVMFTWGGYLTGNVAEYLAKR